MRRVVLIRCEGVLVRENFTGQPIGPGLTLLRWALSDPSREPIIITADKARAQHWLFDEVGANDSLKVWDERLDADDPIKFARYLGYDVELYVDHIPACVVRALQAGVAAMLFAAPAFQRPEFDPQTRSGVRAWGEIAAEVGRQNHLRTETEERLEQDADPLEDEGTSVT